MPAQLKRAPVPADLPAWLGYGGLCPLTVRVCVRCPGASEVMAWARADGCRLHETLCGRHCAEAVAAVMGEGPAGASEAPGAGR